MNAPKIKIVKKTSEPLNFQFANAYPFTEAMAIERNTDGTKIQIELLNPRLKPSQLIPVQASAQALTHGSNVTSTGGPKILPSLISGMPLSDVMIMT